MHTGSRTAVAAVASVALAGVAITPSPAWAFSSSSKASILYVGDSIATETQNTVGWWTQAGGKARFASSVFPGMAICDFLDGEPAARPASMPQASRLQEEVVSQKPDLVILQFWGNDLTPCIDSNAPLSDAYYQAYFYDAATAVNQIAAGASAAGIARPKILWVLQGPDKDHPERSQRINGVYLYVASLSSDSTTDAGYEVSMAADPFGSTLPNPPTPRYQWTEWLPCTTFERANGLCTQPQAFGGVTHLHKASDPVHFCLGDESTWDKFFTCGGATPSPGIVRYGRRIAADAGALLGL